ncbi:OLC1v1012059C1 [Oldenlandia corymbosa var. corymbosa]|uniref:OLC1v1012059C1 n=1 Tax=Oldenlandia corymbosa var. corymbosa TaxID=529605 RepID=A0AAV1DXB3_OLDCO|nr:OLC1v1012059C1 [Oldenlandia corymbosa var. corymbosa]
MITTVVTLHVMVASTETLPIRVAAFAESVSTTLAPSGIAAAAARQPSSIAEALTTSLTAWSAETKLIVKSHELKKELVETQSAASKPAGHVSMSFVELDLWTVSVAGTVTSYRLFAESVKTPSTIAGALPGTVLTAEIVLSTDRSVDTPPVMANSIGTTMETAKMPRSTVETVVIHDHKP